MKKELSLKSLLQTIAICLIAFIFALDLIGAIATFAQVLQVMGQGGTGIEYLLVTSIVELIACISCLVFAFLDERKIKTNSIVIKSAVCFLPR